MQINNIHLISDFKKDHANSRKALDFWTALVSTATWSTTVDVKNTFATADLISGNNWIFNIGGNNFRLYAAVVFANGTVTIIEVMTHAEYSKRDYK